MQKFKGNDGMNLLEKTYDIVVLGGGTAGTAAAIAAARRGSRVLLVEEGNCLGGVSTAGGVNEWYASLEGLGNIFDHVRDEVARFGAKHGRFFNGEYLKIAWQQMAQQAGVEILFHTTLERVEADHGLVRSAGLLSCSRKISARAGFFIDATGEGDLAAMAGGEFQKGDPDQGRTLHMTLTFLLYDTGKPVVPYLPDGLSEIQNDGELPGLNAANVTPDGRVYCNMTKVTGRDATDPFSLSAAEAEARVQLARIVHYLQKTRFPNHMLASSGARIGIREGRRILGDYVLREDDVLDPAGREFEDGITVATCQIDFHSLTKPGHEGWRQKIVPYNIPLRSLIPTSLKNVLVAGKCISGDQVAHSSYRMTPTCCSMGQAAGTAMAMARESGHTEIRRLDPAGLRRQLAADGIELDPQKHRAFAPEAPEDGPGREARA
jgi:hypothetical protein